MNVQSTPAKPGKNRIVPRNLLSLDYRKYGRSIVAYNPSAEVLRSLFDRVAGQIEGIAPLDAVMRVYRHNPETIVVFSRGGWQTSVGPAPMGFASHLPLNASGLDALFTGLLDTANPGLQYVCAQNERPAAIYFWGLHSTPEVAGGMALVMERMTSEKYRDLPIYCRAANSTAYKLFCNLGFVQGAIYQGILKSDLMTCVPPESDAQPEVRPIFDSYIPDQNGTSCRIGITVVHSMDDLLKVLAIRASAYISEQQMPYREDVEGNDLSATHLLAYLGNEPVGCIRIRYFSNFVKLERLAVLKRYRKSRVALSLIKAAIEFGRRKGFTHFYGQVADSVASIWEHFGFVRREGPGIKYLTDECYYEGDLHVPPLENAISPDSGPHILVRPEGQWARPGVLEKQK
ncbi:MAG TPA: GNAT family N-acetyltransferase [Steroidobacteraceae bacterium]|jgi:predicted GNAT family N-acyltransferase|nr:GNAT family N-acetyltransferase [Steroidobacteraceae bacterium]